jgi:hypothetical protein
VRQKAQSYRWRTAYFGLSSMDNIMLCVPYQLAGSALVEKAVGQSRPEARMSAMLSPLCTPALKHILHDDPHTNSLAAQLNFFCQPAAPSGISPSLSSESARHQIAENDICAPQNSHGRWFCSRCEPTAARLGKRAPQGESKGAYIWPKSARGETLAHQSRGVCI